MKGNERLNKPNILLISSDQHRGDSLGCAGHPCVRTPHLDQLAYEGMRFINAYVDAPVCIPARTTMITGIQSHIYGCPQFKADYRLQRDRRDFLGSLMTEAGYQTHLVGKRHWHTEPTFRAGFESVAGLEQLSVERFQRCGNAGDLPEGMGSNEFHPTRSQLPLELGSTHWIVDKAIEFLTYRDQTQPFFLWTSFIDPHPPMCIHEPYYSMYDNEDIPAPVMPEWAEDPHAPHELFCNRNMYNSKPMTQNEIRKMRGVYYGMITHLDFQLGRLLGKLQHQGLLDNTFIIYVSDHGEKLGDFGDLSKSAFYENTAQIPFIIRWPSWFQAEAGNTSYALVELADLLPTICEIAGARTPKDVTGKSLLSIVKGEAEKVRDELHGHINDSHMFHDGTYKYLYFAEDGRELVFDVTKDRKDEHDLSAKQSLLAEMRGKFMQHLTSEGHPHLSDGKLLNRQLQRPSVRELRAKNSQAWKVSQWAMHTEIKVKM
jgi:arylsulfatase A-like enzyme